LKKAFVLTLVAAAGLSLLATAQNNTLAGGQIHGNFEIDAQMLYPDSLIGADTVPEKGLMNGWGNIVYQNGNFSAGIRYESYLNHINGYPSGYSGTGIPYRYASYNNHNLEITVGSSYEQFGSGLALRIYEDRGLGYDNALDGIRVRCNPYRGIYMKGLWGKQRTFMTTGPGIVRGFDAEVNLNELFAPRMDSIKTQFILGGSFVSKYQVDQDPFLVLPLNVGCWSERLNIIRNRVNFYTEFVYKINDPSADNGSIYKPGNAFFSSLTYSRKGFGLYLGLLRVDNFSYRSDRYASLNSSLINYIPALTRQHTYSLAAYYPFASKPNGELSWQFELNYKIKKGTTLGGKYGTDVSVNFSSTYAIDTTKLNDNATARLGYKSDPFKFNDSLYFQDINVEFFHKFSPHFKMTLFYAYIVYNKNVLEGKVGYPLLNAHVNVIDAVWKANDKLTFHSDFEHMYVKEDHGSWLSLLEEVSVGDHIYLIAMDQWNYGNSESSHRVHYYNFQVVYSWATNRVGLSYGKQREGILCVGGVCRLVPASNGFTLTITSSF
jgi:hypothetical protein